MSDPRIVCWFSCGDPSAVAAKLTVAEHAGREIVIARIRIPNEHPDNDRFAADVSRWTNHPITVLGSEKYADCWEVWEKRRFLNGPEGALCTTEMKKNVRKAFQRADDIHVFGYTADKMDYERAMNFRDGNLDLRVSLPLIDAGLTKSDCHAMVMRAGIEIPAMYRLGYQNNNCVGCVKGGMGYWNKVRVDFPEVFQRMAKIERGINHSCLHDDSGPVFLDSLDQKRGHMPSEPDMECGITCYIAERKYA